MSCRLAVWLRRHLAHLPSRSGRPTQSAQRENESDFWSCSCSLPRRNRALGARKCRAGASGATPVGRRSPPARVRRWEPPLPPSVGCSKRSHAGIGGIGAVTRVLHAPSRPLAYVGRAPSEQLAEI